jgi:hypothetical protein
VHRPSWRSSPASASPSQTAAKLRHEKLDPFAEVRVAPLVEVEAGGRRAKWYDLASLDKESRFD